MNTGLHNTLFLKCISLLGYSFEVIPPPRGLEKKYTVAIVAFFKDKVAFIMRFQELINDSKALTPNSQKTMQVLDFSFRENKGLSLNLMLLGTLIFTYQYFRKNNISRCIGIMPEKLNQYGEKLNSDFFDLDYNSLITDALSVDKAFEKLIVPEYLQGKRFIWNLSSAALRVNLERIFLEGVKKRPLTNGHMGGLKKASLYA